MPYYCTVPRCTSMAGKAKNVSFHQFPRDEELAKLWNCILKRGKPYTKYSKVCSLHFRPEDYTITSVGKNKGQWRTLRKDAIPSQNLPSESPVPCTRSSPGAWLPSQPTNTLADPLVQQQMAQAIYMQTMLAMQAAGASDAAGDQPTQIPESTNPSPSSSSLSEIELLLKRDEHPREVTYKCHECTKCFKDPDVFILHKRTHKNTTKVEKENFSANIQDREETLRANPILANLLKTSMRLEPETNMTNILTVENQIMAALASNMEAYIRTLSSMLSNQAKQSEDNNDDDDGSDVDETNDTREREADTDGDNLCETNKSEEETEDVNERLNVLVTACVSRIERPINENQAFSNGVTSADNLVEDSIEAHKEVTSIDEDQVPSNDVDDSNLMRDDFQEDENQNASDKSMDNESKELEASQTTNNHKNYVETKIDFIRETSLERNEDVHGNNDLNESEMHDESSKVNTILDNCVNDDVENTIDDDRNETFQDDDENQMCTETVQNDENTNDDTDENQSNGIDENREDEMCENEGEFNQDNPECDTELIRIELELET